MPGTPDLARLARQLILRVCAEMPHIAAPALVDDVVEQLRHIWNARGAADRTKLEDIWSMHTASVGRSIKILDRALQTWIGDGGCCVNGGHENHASAFHRWDAVHGELRILDCAVGLSVREM